MGMMANRRAADWARAFRIARAARGMTSQDLAAALGVDRSYMSLIERGHRVPSLDLVEKIAAHLRFPVAALATIAEPPSESFDRLLADDAAAAALARLLLAALRG